MWKSVVAWRWYALIALLIANALDGIDINILPAAIFCLQELSEKNSSALNAFQFQIWNDSVTLSNLFGAYTWSAPVMILPVSILSGYVDQEWIFLVVKLIEGLCDFFIPIVLVTQYQWAYLLRAIQGAAAGVIYAGTNVLYLRIYELFWFTVERRKTHLKMG